MFDQFPPPITSSRWGARTKRIIVVAVLVFLAFFIWNIREVLPLLIVAALLSYLLTPLVNFIERRLLFVLPFRARSLAVVLTFMAVLAGFVLIAVLIAPVVIGQISEIGDNLPEFINSAEREFEERMSKPITLAGRPILVDGEPIIPLDYLEQVNSGDGEGGRLDLEDFDIFQVLGTFLSSLGGLTSPIFSVLGGAVNFLINTAFMFVIMFYMMRDGDKFINQFVSTFPDSYKGDVRRLIYELSQVWNAYLRGQLILSLTVGFAVYICALILGLPNAPILGLLSALLEFIPNIGPTIAAVPAVLTALISDSSTFPFLSGLPYALVVAGVWIAIQNVESIFLVPRVMGGSLDLHPVVVIIAVITGAAIAGALGVILAAPFTATARVFGQYLYGKIFDTDPFPSPSPKRSYIPSRLIIFLIQSYPVRLLRSGESDQQIHITEDTQT